MSASVCSLDPSWRHLCFCPLQIGRCMHSWHSLMAWWYRSVTRCCDARRTSVALKLLRLKYCQIQAQSHQSPLPQFHTENTDGLRLINWSSGVSMLGCLCTGISRHLQVLKSMPCFPEIIFTLHDSPPLNTSLLILVTTRDIIQAQLPVRPKPGLLYWKSENQTKMRLTRTLATLPSSSKISLCGLIGPKMMWLAIFTVGGERNWLELRSLEGCFQSIFFCSFFWALSLITLNVCISHFAFRLSVFVLPLTEFSPQTLFSLLRYYLNIWVYLTPQCCLSFHSPASL